LCFFSYFATVSSGGNSYLEYDLGIVADAFLPKTDFSGSFITIEGFFAFN